MRTRNPDSGWRRAAPALAAASALIWALSRLGGGSKPAAPPAADAFAVAAVTPTTPLRTVAIRPLTKRGSAR